MASAAVRKGVGATAALNRVCNRLPMPPVSRAPRRAVWRFLQPLQGPEPPAIAVRAALLGAENRPPLTIENFGMLVTRHALARLFDQFNGTDLCGAIIEAHNALLTLPPQEGEELFALNNIVLPAGPGAFLVEPRARLGTDAPMAVCKTWLSNDQLREHQLRDLATWSEFVASSATA